MKSHTTAGPHWSFWLIGYLALLWNAGSVINVSMQMNARSVAAMPEYMRAVVDTRPVWATAGFVLAAVAGALGSVLLLLRQSAAVPMFVASLIGVGVQAIPSAGMAGASAPVWIGHLTSMTVAIVLIWYSRLAKRKSWVG